MRMYVGVGRWHGLGNRVLVLSQQRPEHSVLEHGIDFADLALFFLFLFSFFYTWAHLFYWSYKIHVLVVHLYNIMLCTLSFSFSPFFSIFFYIFSSSDLIKSYGHKSEKVTVGSYSDNLWIQVILHSYFVHSFIFMLRCYDDIYLYI